MLDAAFGGGFWTSFAVVMTTQTLDPSKNPAKSFREFLVSFFIRRLHVNWNTHRESREKQELAQDPMRVSDEKSKGSATLGEPPTLEASEANRSGGISYVHLSPF